MAYDFHHCKKKKKSKILARLWSPDRNLKTMAVMHFSNIVYDKLFTDVFNPGANNTNRVTQNSIPGLMGHLFHTVWHSNVFGGHIKTLGLIQCCL